MEEDLRSKALELLTSNSVHIRKEWNGNAIEIVYTSPSPGTYNQQWFWDSCLHSLVWLKLGFKERAYEEIQSLVLGKGEREFYPHMIFWDYKKKNIFWWLFDRLYPTNRHSELIQPPIIGYTMKRLQEENLELAINLVKEVTEHYINLLQIRDPEKMNLLTIVHPWESGLDSSPKFDLEITSEKHMRIKQWKRMRRLLKEFQQFNWNQDKMVKESSFKVKCVLTNVLCIWGIEAFLDVLRKYNMKRELNILKEKKNLMIDSLLENCWNEKRGLFFDLEIKKNNHSQIEISTISSLMPLMLEIPSDIKDNLVSHLLDPQEYWPNYPVPTVSLNESSFNPHNSSLLWRGPTWINTNYFIWLGLEKHNEKKISSELAERTINLVKKEGFREFYNPLTGKGGGVKDFGWSTLVTLMD